MSSGHRLSVIVPANPFTDNAGEHCLSAMDVEKLMDWWPGNPHSPHRNPDKVTAIQRALDWKRVAQIAAYLLQRELRDVPEMLDKYFSLIYEPKKNEPGRQWPPKVTKVVGYERSVFPTFSNVLIHVNGAKITNIAVNPAQSKSTNNQSGVAAYLEFDENNKDLNFSVIDGQHRINGAFLAISILKEEKPSARWEIPADIFLNLDKLGGPPIKQAQIFIDVNFYQKKVDRSLVADLFPTARGKRESLDQKERAQDIGRKLMLESGPLVGMIQIPGIRFGVKDVITLATLNTAIESVISIMEDQGITSLELQTEFLVQVLEAWSEISGKSKPSKKKVKSQDDSQNVAYQGRVLVSIITLVPALIWKLKTKRAKLVSDKALEIMKAALLTVANNAGLIKDASFISKTDFQRKGYLGSGGIGRFRNSLWASFDTNKRLSARTTEERIAELAEANRERIFKGLNA